MGWVRLLGAFGRGSSSGWKWLMIDDNDYDERLECMLEGMVWCTL